MILFFNSINYYDKKRGELVSNSQNFNDRENNFQKLKEFKTNNNINIEKDNGNEGDTPEGLAEKFAKEHNLEEETKNKLQNLIHNHMLRLLTRIEEENQSISEKSQATHNNKK